MVGRPTLCWAACAAFIALALACGCATTTGPGTGSPTLVSPGETTTVSGPGGSIVFGPSSVTQATTATIRTASPEGISLGSGCALSNPVVLGAVGFVCDPAVVISGVQCSLGLSQYRVPGSLMYLYHRPSSTDEFSQKGFAVAGPDGMVGTYDAIDEQGTWVAVVPGAG